MAIVIFEVPVDCSSKEQAREIQANIESYTRANNGRIIGIPGNITNRTLRAVAKHRNNLFAAAEAAANKGKVALIAHSGNLLAFVNDIVKG